jgi:hypothetical protein
MSKLLRYRVWCNNSSKFEFVWLAEEDGLPTKCPTDTAHVIDTIKTSIVETVEDNVIEIKEEVVKTNGHFAMEDDLFEIPAIVGVSMHDVTLPFDINLVRGRWFDGLENKEDFADFIIAPDTVIGAIAGNVAVDDTVINVTQTVIDNLDVGYFVSLFDGTNTERVGRCIAIDKENNTITIETASTQAFSAATPTYVRMEIKMASNMSLRGSNQYVMGEGSFKGAHIPKDTKVQVKYNNVDGVAKKFHIIFEYLY